MKRETCPTCGEKRWIPPGFEECTRCHATTNLLNGKPANPEAGDGAWMKLSPYSKHPDPFARV